jgi:hypothetical protein
MTEGPSIVSVKEAFKQFTGKKLLLLDPTVKLTRAFYLIKR